MHCLCLAHLCTSPLSHNSQVAGGVEPLGVAIAEVEVLKQATMRLEQKRARDGEGHNAHTNHGLSDTRLWPFVEI